ncbi:MAG: hypothetical protein E6713_05995 [Sporomusaceae bacterium]|nr:hypothetical protein [Sporomusaceae bacterium]
MIARHSVKQIPICKKHEPVLKNSDMVLIFAFIGFVALAAGLTL